MTIADKTEKDMKTEKDILDDIQMVVNRTYKMIFSGERVSLPAISGYEPLIRKASLLLGEPGECPVCGNAVMRTTLGIRRKELKDCTKAIKTKGEL